MQNKKKKLLAVATFASGILLTVGMITFQPDVHSLLGDVEDMGITLNASNGAASDTSLKSKFVTAKSKFGNDVKMVLKNCEVVSGKVAKVKARGWYGNEAPVNGATKIVVASNAAAGDAVVKYGLTSACLDGEFDLAVGQADGIEFNYFKIFAKKDVTIDSINIDWTCDNSKNGFEALYGETDNRSAYEFVSNSSNGYDFRPKSASSSHYVNKLVVPDYYTGANGYLPVTGVMHQGNYGLFEKAYEVKEVYFPETITEFGTYIWSGTHDKINQITFPRDLTKSSGSGRIVPSSASLSEIYYNSKNLVYTGSSGIDSSKQPKLKDIYVSYDVESLPNNFITSFVSGTTIHYEGTTTEWAALVSSATKWNSADTIICSDTVTKTVTLNYENSTLGGDASGVKELVYVNKALGDPGDPIWTGEGAKVFDGWYTQATGGDKVSFPYTPANDINLYAQFIDKPAGYDVLDPVDVIKGEYDVVTRADLGVAEYFKYTATTDEVVIFETGAITSAQSTSGEIRVFNVDGTDAGMSASASYSAEESVKKFANFTNKSSTYSTVKIRFEAGESYVIGYSSYNFTTGYYGKTKLKIYSAADVYGDHECAKPYTVGTNATMTDLKGNVGYWHSFTVDTAGSYSVDFNNAGDKNCANSIGYFKDGVWTELASSNYSAQTKIVSLSTGVTYYVNSRGQGTKGTYGFKVYAGAPQGYEVSNPIILPTDGTEVTNASSVATWNYFKVTIPTNGTYKFTCSSNVASSDSVSYSSKTNSQSIQLSASSAITDVIAGARELVESSSSKSIIYNLDAGEYYIKATIPSSETIKFSMSAVAASDVEGLSVLSAKDITLTSGTAINTSDAGANGKLYKFTVNSTFFHVFTADKSATVKIGSKSNSGVISYYNNSYTMSNGEMHMKLVNGNTYYMYVKGASSVGFSLVESIQDGKSTETAYTYVMGTEEKTTGNGGRVGSTCTYFKFVATADKDIEVTRGSTGNYNFKLKKGESVQTATSTSGVKQIYSIESGATYYIEAYDYGFSIVELNEGATRNLAINKTVSSTDSSVTLNAANAANGTWYKFTSDYAGYTAFSLTDANASAEIYVNNNTSIDATCTSTKVGTIGVSVGDVVYIKVNCTTAIDVVFGISHPASFENGKGFGTAFIYTNDAEQNYMSMTDKTIAENTDGTYCYIKFVCAKNTDYVFYSLSTSGDFDTAAVGINTTIVFDANKTGISAYTDWDIGASDEDPNYPGIKIKDKTGSTNTNDCYARFNSGDNEVVYVRYKLKNYNHKIVIRTATDLFA